MTRLELTVHRHDGTARVAHETYRDDPVGRRTADVDAVAWLDVRGVERVTVARVDRVCGGRRGGAR